MKRTNILHGLATLFLTLVSQTVVAQLEIKPEITDVSPTSGEPGTLVTITGRNFNPDYKVRFSDLVLPPLKQTDTQIIVEIPKNARHDHFVLDGHFKITSDKMFFVGKKGQGPSILGINPKRGKPGTVVTITGQNFSTVAHENFLSINGVAMDVISANKTRIKAAIAPGSQSGKILLEVYEVGTANSKSEFVVVENPQITDINPLVGGPGSTIIISGRHFSSIPELNTVSLNGVPCNVIAASQNQLMANLPEKKAASGKIRVNVKGAGSIQYDKPIKIIKPPVINEFSPTTGKHNTNVTITGQHFGNGAEFTSVKIGSKNCPILSVTNNTVQITIPPDAISAPFVISVNNIVSQKSVLPFKVQAPLSISSIEPTAALPGAEVTIFGTGFSKIPKKNAVYLGENRIFAHKVTDNAIVFKVPKAITDGPTNLSVKASGSSRVQSSVPFSVMHSPVIKKITPTQGPIGTLVAIEGQFLGHKKDDIRVTLGGKAVSNFALTPHWIKFRVPKEGKSGHFQIFTTNRGMATSKRKFTITVPVKVRSFLPAMGPPGQIVHIFGTGFSEQPSQNKVMLNGKRLVVKEASSTLLKVKLPKGAATGRINVSVAKKKSSAESIQPFRITKSLAISDFSPKHGVPGTIVTIRGSGFSNIGLKAFVGQTPIGVRVDSNKQLSIANAPGTQSGPLRVSSPWSKDFITQEPFLVDPPPDDTPTDIAANTSFNPSQPEARVLDNTPVDELEKLLGISQNPVQIHGFDPITANPGDYIVIEGQGFGDDASAISAWIGNTKADVIDALQDMVQLKIPMNAKDGFIKIKVGIHPEVLSKTRLKISL